MHTPHVPARVAVQRGRSGANPPPNFSGAPDLVPYGGGGKGREVVPFALAAILLVAALVVVILLAVYALGRWL